MGMETFGRGLSRQPQVDLEKCVEIVGGNRYDLVLMASARHRQIGIKKRANKDFTSGNTISALLDIQNGLTKPR